MCPTQWRRKTISISQLTKRICLCYPPRRYTIPQLPIVSLFSLCYFYVTFRITVVISVIFSSLQHRLCPTQGVKMYVPVVITDVFPIVD